MVVHSSLDGPYCEEGTVGGAAAGEAVKQKGDSGEQTARVLFGEAVKQNGDLADHAAREFMDEAAKAEGDSGEHAAREYIEVAVKQKGGPVDHAALVPCGEAVKRIHMHLSDGPLDTHFGGGYRSPRPVRGQRLRSPLKP